MIRLQAHPMETVADIRAALQKAIQLEFATLPPYLYAMYTIREGTNAAARTRIAAIVREEMTHMALACNVLNAIGGSPVVADVSVVPTYPGPLPFDIGGADGTPFRVGLLPFSPEAIDQAIRIEEPEHPIDIPDAAPLASTFQTIGQFYAALEKALRRLRKKAWVVPPSKQLTDNPFFPGEIFPVTGFADASRAIQRIVSEGEGTSTSPLDFEGEVAHFYRFEEIRRGRELQKDPTVPEGFSFGKPLGVDFDDVIPAIANPGEHDFTGDAAGQAAQNACDRVFTVMLQDLHRAVNGEPGRLGHAVRGMKGMNMAARAALALPLAGTYTPAGPAFRFRPELV